jgi:hypothetical protein
MAGPFDAGQSLTSGSPLGDEQPLGQRPDQGLPQQATPGIEQMMQDPQFQQFVQAATQKKKKATLKDLLNGGGTIEELAAAYPKIQQIAEQKKLDDAKEKVHTLQFSSLEKRAQKAFELKQQQQQQGAA